ncbi:MAG: phosphoribosyltransferase family protein [Planctomycetota bacterium]
MPYSRILLDKEQLSRIVSRLGAEISSQFRSEDNCMALVVLEGAKTFANDLLAKVDFPVDIETITASSYSGANSTGNVMIEKTGTLGEKIQGRNILLIDDIYDTGLTLSRILDWLKTLQPNSIQTCVLLEKEIEHAKQIDIDFIGTTIEDVFAIGYGLDFEGQYRDLPCIGELSEERSQQYNAAPKT